MIDTHCHVDLYPSPAKVIKEIDRRGVYVLAVTTTPKAYRGNIRLVENSKRIRVAVGLHPELVAERHREIDELCKLMAGTRYVGEVGIDGSPEHTASRGLQFDVFSTALCRAEELGGKIISIHSRSASGLVLDAIEKHVVKSTPILHWFSGPLRDLKRAIDLGCWFSVGPAMLRSKKGSELVAQMPIDRILPETDGPFASDGKSPLMPWDSQQVNPKIAEIWKSSDAFVRSTFRSNFERLLVRPEPVSHA
ncbi:Qat anti-phage system TatD family nuclease QatD [Rhodobacter capsulatus]|uniref:Qat anti-phage system TatD family nuclease QatD n=1 Tax=Rhodobacter capsulatus TaxID=1061 RepID=UPI0003D30A55|nr:Qat anti-phage system TatD family nuclease QatD [Rhodobacter capsulatus]ETD86331.1 TatD family hydrolase [Rhodobacter capsulatus YW1]